MPSPLDEVLDAFQALLDARRSAPVPAEAGRGNFRCERCVDCSHCRFCTDCTACEDCTYCEGCQGCTGCTHCKHCARCKQTTHSAWSSECSESSYLTLCLDCKACVQCFACVGLQNEEFCILNEKLPRKAYFSRVAALRGALEERMAAGWRPPWEPAPELDEAHEAEDEDESDDEDAAVHDEDEERTPVPIRQEEVAPLRADVRFEASRREAAMLREDLRADAARREAVLSREDPRADAVRREAMRSREDLRTDAVRRDASWSRASEPLPRVEPVLLPRVEPVPLRAEVDPRASTRPEPQWTPPAPPPPAPASPESDERAGRSEITVDVVEDDAPPISSRGGTPPWSFADARRGRLPPAASEPEEELIPEPPPFGSGPHPVAHAPVVPEETPVVPRAGDEPTRRRDRARPADPPRDRYGWSAQAEGTPVRMGWSVQAEGEPERLSWSTSDDGPERGSRSTSEPRASRWSAIDDGSGRWGRPDPAGPRAGWSPKADTDPQAARPGWSPKADTDPQAARPGWSPKADTDPGVSRPGWSPKADTDPGVSRSGWSPKASPAPSAPRLPRSQKGGWDEPPELRRDPHEDDFDRRRRETAASPSASEVDLDNLPVAYGRNRPFDPEPPLQLDVWSAYEQIQRSRLSPDEQTEPDAPVARRGLARADLGGAAVASDEDPARRSETRTTPKVDDDAPAEAAARSLNVARRPERPRPPEPRDRGTAMLRGRAPARPNPPAPARQPDAPSLRRARRPSRVRDESTSEYLAVDPPVDDPEQS